MLQKAKYIFASAFFIVAMATLGAGLAYANTSIVGTNDTTGPNSENENEWDVDSGMDIDVANDAEADTDFEICVNTGENSIAENTEVGGDDVATGDIWASFEVSNDLNNEEIAMGNMMDENDVMVELSNEITGPHSENSNEVAIDNGSDIDIDNDAEVDNDIGVFANTGRNTISHNTVVGDVETGSINIEGSVQNSLNQNSGSMELNGNESDVSVDLSNQTTGPNSENENQVDIDNGSDVDIDNDAEINNDLNISANTGENHIGHNTVVGDVETGSINIDFSISNSAN